MSTAMPGRTGSTEPPGSRSARSSAWTTCAWRWCSTRSRRRIGGVLVRGEKGTAKSTMVRALAAVLPDVDGGAPAAGSPATRPRPTRPARTGRTSPAGGGPSPGPPGWSSCRSGRARTGCVGALDIERALTEGVKAYEPGLLAAAHRGVLYVDEVNLLHDHLVDLLLDAAALGICYVERDGVSVRHAARFLLVGTMNPEEGELRPQLLDRFGLTVEAAAPRDPAPRAEVVRRRLAYDADPAAFAGRLARGRGRAGRADRRGPAPAAVGGAAGRRAAPGGVGVRGVRRGRDARRPRHRAGRDRARGVAGPGRGHRRGRAGRGPAGAAAPAPAPAVRRAAARRAATRRGAGRGRRGPGRRPWSRG